MDEGRRFAVEALLETDRFGEVRPRLHFYPQMNSPLPAPKVIYTPGNDYYFLLMDFDREKGEWASLRLIVTPLVFWMWVAGGSWPWAPFTSSGPRRGRRKLGGEPGVRGGSGSSWYWPWEGFSGGGCSGTPRSSPPSWPRSGGPPPTSPSPSFPLPGGVGEAFRLADHLGKRPIVLNFWASWCYPACYEEAPILEASWRRHREEVLFVGVNTQDKQEEALRFIAQFGLTFPQVYDPRGRVGVDYGMYGVPETFFIDREGRVLARHAGAIDEATLARYLEEALR